MRRYAFPVMVGVVAGMVAAALSWDDTAPALLMWYMPDVKTSWPLSWRIRCAGLAGVTWLALAAGAVGALEAGAFLLWKWTLRRIRLTRARHP